MDYLPLIAAALIGVLVPASTRWLWRKIEQPLSEINRRMTNIEAKQAEQALDIAFLKGVQSERQQVATTMQTAATLAAVASPFGDHTPAP